MKKNFKKLFGAVLLGSMLLSSPVYAEEAGVAAKMTSSTIVDSDNFSKLVENGIIDEATAQKMKDFFEIKNEEMTAEMEKINAMTEDEVMEYFKNQENVEFLDPYVEMVSKNILTQEQADKINEFNHEQFKKHMEEEVTKQTKRYVSEGILTEEKASKVKDFLLNEDRFFGNFAVATTSTIGASLDEEATVNDDFKVIKIDVQDDNSMFIKRIENSTSAGIVEGREAVINREFSEGEIPESISISVFSSFDAMVEEGIITEDEKTKMEESDKAYYESISDGEVINTKNFKFIVKSEEI